MPLGAHDIVYDQQHAQGSTPAVAMSSNGFSPILTPELQSGHNENAALHNVLQEESRLIPLRGSLDKLENDLDERPGMTNGNIRPTDQTANPSNPSGSAHLVEPSIRGTPLQAVFDIGVGSSKPEKLTRRKSTTSSAARQSYSCAECRRLKLKCDRVWPCNSCKRRGVDQICPNGSMMGGKGRRLILASHSELHSRISELEKALAISHGKGSAQPHELLTNTYLYSPRDPKILAAAANMLPEESKNAIPAVEHSEDEAQPTTTKRRRTDNPGGRGGSSDGNSDEDLIATLDPPSKGKGKAISKNKARGVQPEPKRKVSEEDMVEVSLGTLTITQNGEAHFVGASGGSSLLHADGVYDQGRDSDSIGPLSIPQSIQETTSRPNTTTVETAMGDFPFACSITSSPNDLTLYDLWRRVPAWDKIRIRNTGGLWATDVGSGDLRGRVADDGMSMVKAYWENVDWMYNIVPRVIFDNDYLPSVYETVHPPNAHKLAVVYLVMALGVMFDLETREPYDPLASDLFRLGLACMTVQGGLARASVATVQALNLIGNYMLNDRSTSGANAFWPILGVANSTVTALGLHRDGTTFGGLSPYEIEERRKVFWEMTALDRLQAMCFARPCALPNRSVDAKFPGSDATFPEHRLPDDDRYHEAKYKIVQLMESVIEEQTRTTRGSYAHVLSIDNDILSFRNSLPESMIPAAKASSLSMESDIHPHTVLHRLSIRLLVMETRIYLHRTYFVQALHHNPVDPSNINGRFHKSFVYTFESAVELISIVKQGVIYHPALIARWWFWWFHAFSAAVCLAAICIHAPSSAFAAPSYMSLVTACDLAQAAKAGSKAKGGLPVLKRLRQKASNAMLSTAQSYHSIHASLQVTTAAPTVITAEDDLSHLAQAPTVRRLTAASPTLTTPALTNQESSLVSSIGSGPRSISDSTPRSDPFRLNRLGIASPEENNLPEGNLFGGDMIGPGPPLPIFRGSDDRDSNYHRSMYPTRNDGRNFDGFTSNEPASPPWVDVEGMRHLHRDFSASVSNDQTNGASHSTIFHSTIESQRDSMFNPEPFTGGINQLNDPPAQSDHARGTRYPIQAFDPPDAENPSVFPGLSSIRSPSQTLEAQNIFLPFDQMDAYGIFTDKHELSANLATPLSEEQIDALPLLPPGGNLSDVEQFIAGLDGNYMDARFR